MRWRIWLKLSHVYSRQEVKTEDCQPEKIPDQFSLCRLHYIPDLELKQTRGLGLSSQAGCLLAVTAPPFSPCREKQGRAMEELVFLNPNPLPCHIKLRQMHVVTHPDNSSWSLHHWLLVCECGRARDLNAATPTLGLAWHTSPQSSISYLLSLS